MLFGLGRNLGRSIDGYKCGQRAVWKTRELRVHLETGPLPRGTQEQPALGNVHSLEGRTPATASGPPAQFRRLNHCAISRVISR